MGSGGQDHTSQDHFCSVMDEFPVWNSETKQSCDDERSFSSWARGCDVAVCCIASMTAWTGAGSVWAVADLHACDVFFPRTGTARRDCSYERNFAQWRYSNQWSNREVLLLLVENYNQYPAPTRWNTLVCGNFWPALRGRNMTERLKQVLRWDRLGVGSAGHRTSLLGLLAKIKV